VGIRIEREDATARVEVCDQEGTTGRLNGLKAISHCTACRKTCPARFGAGAPTVKIVRTEGLTPDPALTLVNVHAGGADTPLEHASPEAPRVGLEPTTLRLTAEIPEGGSGPTRMAPII
jgi:hypothetical protein